MCPASHGLSYLEKGHWNYTQASGFMSIVGETPTRFFLTKVIAVNDPNFLCNTQYHQPNLLPSISHHQSWHSIIVTRALGLPLVTSRFPSQLEAENSIHPAFYNLQLF